MSNRPIQFGLSSVRGLTLFSTTPRSPRAFPSGTRAITGMTTAAHGLRNSGGVGVTYTVDLLTGQIDLDRVGLGFPLPADP